jgi:hypothetical protein
MLHSVAGTATVVGTSVRAIASVFGTASFGCRVRQIELFNTTTTACSYALVRFTNATGVGAGLTEVDHDINPAQCTAFAGHTGDGAVTAPYDVYEFPAAQGGGFIKTYGDSGILVPVGTANGFGVILLTGTGQILRYKYTWEE